MQLVEMPGIGEILDMLIEQLERCQNALAAYLEEKRAKFPRFYFLGDDDLLEILGQARNPSVIQTHLKKLFQGLHKVLYFFDYNNFFRWTFPLIFVKSQLCVVQLGKLYF